jgi:hypothetical protein
MNVYLYFVSLRTNFFSLIYSYEFVCQLKYAHGMDIDFLEQKWKREGERECVCVCVCEKREREREREKREDTHTL